MLPSAIRPCQFLITIMHIIHKGIVNKVLFCWMIEMFVLLVKDTGLWDTVGVQSSVLVGEFVQLLSMRE